MYSCLENKMEFYKLAYKVIAQYSHHHKHKALLQTQRNRRFKMKIGIKMYIMHAHILQRRDSILLVTLIANIMCRFHI